PGFSVEKASHDRQQRVGALLAADRLEQRHGAGPGNVLVGGTGLGRQRGQQALGLDVQGRPGRATARRSKGVAVILQPATQRRREDIGPSFHDGKTGIPSPASTRHVGAEEEIVPMRRATHARLTSSCTMGRVRRWIIARWRAWSNEDLSKGGGRTEEKGS